MSLLLTTLVLQSGAKKRRPFESLYIYIYIYAQRLGWALPQGCSVEGSHSQSNVVATLHSIGKINKGIREY